MIVEIRLIGEKPIDVSVEIEPQDPWKYHKYEPGVNTGHLRTVYLTKSGRRSDGVAIYKEIPAQKI